MTKALNDCRYSLSLCHHVTLSMLNPTSESSTLDLKHQTTELTIQAQQFMHNLYHRISNYIHFSHTAMEDQVRKFFGRFKPAFGYLQVLKGKLPSLQSLEDCHVDDSALFARSDDDQVRHNDISQPQSIDHTNGSASQPQSTENFVVTSEDATDIQGVSPNSDDNEHIEHDQPPESQSTEGPSRFVSARDGSRDCVALLVNDRFLAELNALFQGDRDLNALDGPLDHAKIDLRNIERSVQESQDALERAKTEQEAATCYETMEQQKIALHKTRHWKDELENERAKVESQVDLSRSHTKRVLETAMREANLLAPEKPLPAILAHHEDSEPLGSENHVVENETEASELMMPTDTPLAPVAPEYSQLPISSEDIERQEAWDYFVQREQALDNVQAKFDNQKQNYHNNLTKYLQDFETGDTTMTRSAFDRRSVRYGQQLTRALINIEEEFEDARDQALALNALPSDYGHEFYYGAVYEESWPADKIADYLASEDWTFVESWLDGIPDFSSSSSSSSSPFEMEDDAVEIDEWEAEEVEVNDSVSVMDFEDYRRDIDRYRRMCAGLEDPCPEVRWLGQMDGRVVERRRSCWM